MLKLPIGTPPCKPRVHGSWRRLKLCNAPYTQKLKDFAEPSLALAGTRINGNKRGPRLRCCSVDVPWCRRPGLVISLLSSSHHLIYYNGTFRFNDFTLFLGPQDTVLGHLAPYLSWIGQILPSLPLRMSPTSKRSPKMMLLEQERVPHSLAGPIGAFLVSGDFLLLV